MDEFAWVTSSCVRGVRLGGEWFELGAGVWVWLAGEKPFLSGVLGAYLNSWRHGGSGTEGRSHIVTKVWSLGHAWF